MLAPRIPCGHRVGHILAASALILSSGCGKRAQEKPQETAEQLVSQRVVPQDQPTPDFSFPENVRSKNDELNNFLEEFQQVCANGEYFRYRDLVSRQVEPIARDQFVGIWRAVAHVKIELIRRLPLVDDMRKSNVLGPLEAVHDPVYAVLVRVDLRENAKVHEPNDRFVSLLVFREGSSEDTARWVLAPAPERVRTALRKAAGVEQVDEVVYFSGGGASSSPASSPSSSD